MFCAPNNFSYIFLIITILLNKQLLKNVMFDFGSKCIFSTFFSRGKSATFPTSYTNKYWLKKLICNTFYCILFLTLN